MFLSLFSKFSHSFWRFEDFPDIFVTFYNVFVTFLTFFSYVFQCSIINFSLHAIKLNKTPKFNESSELIIYLTCEERRREPSTLFGFKIWLKETQISDIETF